ncbi:Ig-like domain-containing protein [Chitinimonas sp. BJB300]|uniref:Ig-like domain-containing protein n=1 Tax=Chitinimonas sp. BJB300 TaxID=1559339 RepID=UPI001112069F|nr:Ig-like domain-containing protein [Chitinimonas sp. BJB300]TSJ91500.1 hypothetical protein FG002_004300 [Chitinimonas sp. BJB300]
MLLSTTSLSSDGAATIKLTAIVKDAGNVGMADQAVRFSTNVGTINNVLPVTAKTDATGVVTAELSAGNQKATQDITVTASSGSVSAIGTAKMSGTKLTVTGVSSLVIANSTALTIRLQDGGGKAISGQAVVLASSLGNTFKVGGADVTSVTTDQAGQATVTYSAKNGGADVVTASALNESGTLPIAVSSESFVLSASAPGGGVSFPANAPPEVNLGSNVTVSVVFAINGVAQANKAVSFTSTRGTVSSSSVVTDANGRATITVSSNNAGNAVVTASSGSVSGQFPIEFVATTPSTLTLQIESSTVAPEGVTSVKATVRDAAGNLVKNKQVDFTLSDVTGGFLSVAKGTTDSSGETTTSYTASKASSAKDGVVIVASVANTLPVIQSQAKLTVGGKAVFVKLGTDNLIASAPDQQPAYIKTYQVLVTDSPSSPIKGAKVQLTLEPVEYYKGAWDTPTGATTWKQNVTAVCANEDLNFNGILDTGTEIDENSDGAIQPGNVAAVIPGTVTTNESGFALFKISYPKNHAGWVKVRVTARATVNGSESSSSELFLLTIAASDVGDLKVSPPGATSPFGVAAVCTNKN